MKKISFNEALAIQQTGAKVIGLKKTPKGEPIYELGGGIFTPKELIKARMRYGISRGWRGDSVGHSIAAKKGKMRKKGFFEKILK